MIAESPLAIATRGVRVGWRTGLWRHLRAGPAPLLRLALAPSPLAVLPDLHAAATPDALAWADRDQALDWAEAADAVARVAGGLAAMGIGARDRVLLAMPNRVEYLVAWFALFRLGATAVHAPYDATDSEMAHLVATAGPRLAIATRAVPCCATVDVDTGFARLRESAPLPARRVQGGDSVVFTSGTTGRPKGAVRDFARLGPMELLRILDRLPLATDERHLVVSRLYHSAAQAFVLLVASLGGAVHLRGRFDAEATWADLARESITSVFMVPTMIQRLLAVDGRPPACLRALVSGAGPFAQPLREAAIARFGPGRIFDFYGATELGWVTTCDGHEMQARPGTLGRALGGQRLEIRDDAGRALPPDTVGTVWVQNGQTFSGYLGRGESDGWVTCEDLGRLDADGYLYLHGRARDMVVSGGVNLYPAEIEGVLQQHPAVAEVAVVGAPDPEWGERLVAFVVGDVAPTDLQTFARAHLVGSKVPRDWRVVDALPRTATGKVKKAILRAGLAETG